MSGWLQPGLLLGLLLSAGYAALFHLWNGRSLGQLMLYLVASLIGFAVGQAIGAFTEIPFLQIGQIHTVEATVGAWLGLIAAWLLTQERLPGVTR